MRFGWLREEVSVDQGMPSLVQLDVLRYSDFLCI